MKGNNMASVIKKMADTLRNIDICIVLQQAGALRDQADTKKWHTTQGIISITGQKFFNWNRYCGGGGAIDMAMHLMQTDFKTALYWLKNNCSKRVLSNHKAKKTLRLPQPYPNNLPKVVAYLYKKRAIHENLIYELINKKKLYADKYANAVFVLSGKNNIPQGAQIRATSNSKWLAMAPGSNKDLGYFYIKAKHTNNMVICESAIDAISYFQMNPHCLAVSTAGAIPNPKWLKYFVNSNFDISCGYDADYTGDTMAQKMIDIYPSIKRIRPEKKDWNQVLMDGI
jgi:hypothetical protein